MCVCSFVCTDKQTQLLSPQIAPSGLSFPQPRGQCQGCVKKPWHYCDSMWVQICSGSQMAMRKNNLTDCQVSIRNDTVPTGYVNDLSLVRMLWQVEYAILLVTANNKEKKSEKIVEDQAMRTWLSTIVERIGLFSGSLDGRWTEVDIWSDGCTVFRGWVQERWGLEVKDPT